MRAIIMVGAVVLFLVFVKLWAGSETPPPAAAQAVAAAPRVEAAPQPVSDGCMQLAEAAEANRIVRVGGVDRSGATLLVDLDWSNMDFDTQRTLAECISHYMGGGQDRWIKRIRFVNQPTGRTLGTIENTRYRIGE